MSNSQRGKKRNTDVWNKGLKTSDEHKEKLSESLKGKKHNLKLVKCPFCNKEGSGPNMTRYHFDNCKNIKD